jgi:hypothetical protein
MMNTFRLVTSESFIGNAEKPRLQGIAWSRLGKPIQLLSLVVHFPKHASRGSSAYVLET